MKNKLFAFTKDFSCIGTNGSLITDNMDLFGVFDEEPVAVEPSVTEVSPVPKRDLSEPSEDEKKVEKKATPAQKKKQRQGSISDKPKPVVTDSFETDTSREVVASAGLLPQAPQETKQVTLSHQVRHQVALPPNYDYVPISQHKSENPARTYPFTLDPFQAVSVASIERNESVLVSAHTSAGKTVVAEYAIAQSLRDKQRVIYTSPIKALSNQKYRELQADFGDVGLMTGDVTINPEASCLVMTTEILRSMLYRGSEVMREVAWVIFDEIHYMRDSERGVVWEETIILLPDNVHYVFLSATIPNAMQFAEWICKTHNQPCHVVYTNFRPTPLQHYLFPAGGEGIHLVVDEKGQFREENFQKAMGSLGDKMGEDSASVDAKHKKGKIAKGGKKDVSDIYKIVKMIMMKNYNPVIVFSFSKRDCESLALKISKLDFNSSEEADMVSKIFGNALMQLSEADRSLPQIEHILPLLRRGIGIHHSGLLPILKEVIEILFQEGLIKVLFATETFSIGLNMPAKTVVFTNVRKFDGKDFRWVSGGEYIQMSGRAGRRGLDDRGIVIMMLDETMEPAVAKGMVKGEADRLDSAFHLSYNMILNLLRVEGISPEFMLERCFYQFQNQESIPEYEKQLTELKEQVATYEFENEEQVREYYDLRQQMNSYKEDVRKVITHPDYILPFLQAGRLVHVKVGDLDFDWGAVVSFNHRRPDKRGEPYEGHESILVEVLVYVSSTSPIQLQRAGNPVLHPGIVPAADKKSGKMEVLTITLSSLLEIANMRVVMPKELTAPVQRRTVKKSIDEIKRRFPEGIKLLDPIKNMKIKDEYFDKLMTKIELLDERLEANPLHNAPELAEVYNKFSEKMAVIKQGKEIKHKLTKALSILQLDELRCRKRVLRQLEFTTASDIVELKGRVACEISSGDELVLTEMIFNGTFSDLSPEQCAALLSCFVFDETTKEAPTLAAELQGPYNALKDIAKRIATVSRNCKLNIVVDDYVKKFKFELMEVVYHWCKGATFSQICKMTDVYEGSLIRLFRRLEELIRQMVDGAKIIGNNELQEKMTKAMELIKRDLVSAASLYL